MTTEQYRHANSMLKSCDAVSDGGDSVSVSVSIVEGEVKTQKKIKIDLTLLPSGTYEYFTDCTTIIGQILSYMYNTIESVTYLSGVDDTTTIPFKIRRRPYKYDGEDNGYMTLGYGSYKYEYKPIVCTPQTVMNSLLQFKDEDYPVHQLEGVDVIEEKDGITISDIFDGSNLFINDDDLVYLYEILKERLISKY